MKDVRDETLVRVGHRAGLSMNLLKKSHHPSHQEVHIVHIIWLERNLVQLLFKMAHFNNGLGLGHLKHLPVEGRLYSTRVFLTRPTKVRCYTCDEARPLSQV